MAHDRDLIAQVGEPAIERRDSFGAQSGGVAGSEPADEGVGVAPAAVNLDRQVETFLRHRREEARNRGGTIDMIFGLSDVMIGWYRDDPIYRAGSFDQECREPGLTEQDVSASG